MLYREAGEYKTSYRADLATFPIRIERWGFWAVMAVAALVVPFFVNDYWEQAIFLPFFIYALAALGLNILTGYCGQLSLGTGGFMAVGAYASYKLMPSFPGLDMISIVLISGATTAAVGVFFGLPSLRIKGFYLAVATLAAQFFITWLFNKVGWFYNNNPSGTIIAPPRTMFGIMITGPEATAETRYLVGLAFVTFFALLAKNLVRGRIGRAWMAIRDMDIAAELMGIRPLQTKLLAFAISSFYCGLAGAMMVFLWLGSGETETFPIDVSFQVLFMVIIGGLGSILGSFMGAAFITILPILLTNAPPMVGIVMPIALAKHLEEIIFGCLIIYFLVVEPNGLARLWQIAKEKLRRWPFPY